MNVLQRPDPLWMSLKLHDNNAGVGVAPVTTIAEGSSRMRFASHRRLAYLQQPLGSAKPTLVRRRQYAISRHARGSFEAALCSSNIA
jgi:hypothetical protein